MIYLVNMKPFQLFLLGLLLVTQGVEAQKRKTKSTNTHFVVQDSLYHSLKWRNIGPFRGGRSVASSGVVGQPMTYYMGTTVMLSTEYQTFKVVFRAPEDNTGNLRIFFRFDFHIGEFNIDDVVFKEVDRNDSCT